MLCPKCKSEMEQCAGECETDFSHDYPVWWECRECGHTIDIKE